MSTECEMIDWSTKLSTLKEKGLISEVEYREIVCKNGPFVERALLKLLFTKYRLQGANILKLFEELTAEIPVVVNNKDNARLQHDEGGKNQQTNNPLCEKNKNPLLINTVLLNLFEFLTFEEIKQYRVVCHQWDSTAQPFLRRKGIIHFKPSSFKQSMFSGEMEDNLPELPFTSFKFSNIGCPLLWSYSQLQMFFEKWGTNIKHLELFNVCLWNLSHCDVTPWLEMTANLTNLTIKSYFVNPRHLRGLPDKYTPLQVELDKLKSVKYLNLFGHNILICLSNQTMIAPLEIILNCVRFKDTDRVALDNDVLLLRLNNYIDFSQAKNIILMPCAINNTEKAIFDMAGQDFKADKVFLNNIVIQNWNKAKGKIDCLTLFETRLIEKNDLEIKQFILNSCIIDMAIIPMTIEQIHFVDRRTKIICDHSIVLPNLVFLLFKNVTQHSLDIMLSRFAYCNNLVEIEMENIFDIFYSLILNVSLIPKSLKRMKINGIVRLVRGDNDVVRSLDKLIFGDRRCDLTNFFFGFSDMLSTVVNVNVRVLGIDFEFLNLNCHVTFRYQLAIMNFVKVNQHLEKIMVGNLENVYKYISFETSSFYRCVDRESYYYEFEKNNTMGKAITKDQFLLWKSLNVLTLD